LGLENGKKMIDLHGWRQRRTFRTVGKCLRNRADFTSELATGKHHRNPEPPSRAGGRHGWSGGRPVLGKTTLISVFGIEGRRPQRFFFADTPPSCRSGPFHGSSAFQAPRFGPFQRFRRQGVRTPLSAAVKPLGRAARFTRMFVLCQVRPGRPTFLTCGPGNSWNGDRGKMVSVGPRPRLVGFLGILPAFFGSALQ